MEVTAERAYRAVKVLQSDKKVEKLSIVGHSFGGIYGRFTEGRSDILGNLLPRATLASVFRAHDLKLRSCSFNLISASEFPLIIQGVGKTIGER